MAVPARRGLRPGSGIIGEFRVQESLSTASFRHYTLPLHALNPLSHKP